MSISCSSTNFSPERSLFSPIPAINHDNLGERLRHGMENHNEELVKECLGFISNETKTRFEYNKELKSICVFVEHPDHDIEKLKSTIPLLASLGSEKFSINVNSQAFTALESFEEFVGENGPFISHLSLDKLNDDLKRLQSLVSLTPNISSITLKALLGPNKIQIPHDDRPRGPRDTYGYTDIHMAAEKGFTELVKILINRGRDVNQAIQFVKQPEMGETPLLFAVKNGHYDVAKILLENGARVDERTLFGNSPLLTAAKQGNEKIVELLLDYNAAVNQCNISGLSALHLAAENGHEKVVEVLLNRCANVNQLANNGSNPLLSATFNNHEKVISLLFNNKSDIYLRSNKGYSFITLLKMVRPIKWKQMQMQIKLQRASDDEVKGAFEYSKQFTQVKLISHAFGVGRIIDVQQSEIRGAGSRAEFAAAKIAKSIQMFSAEFPNLLDINTSQELAKGIQMLADQNSLTVDDYLESIHSGRPSFILTGFEGHSVVILIWNNFLVICNRGEEHFYYPVKIGRIDPTKIDKEIIQQLIDLRTKIQDDYHDAIIGYSHFQQGSLLQKLNFNGSSPNDKELSKLTSLPWQTIGNCTWANMEQAIMSYLLLAKLKERGFSIFDNPQKNKILAMSTYFRFNCWLLYQKIAFVEKHIVSGYDPGLVVPHVFENLRSELSKVFVDIAPEFERKINVLEKLYLERISNPGPSSSQQ